MPIEKIFAHLSCTDIERSIPWFTKLFSRGPDASPMPGLAEWHQTENSAFQLFQDAKNAGRATMTLGVSDLASERSRLAELKLSPGEIERADDVDIVRLRDPDQNLVVLAAARS